MKKTNRVLLGCTLLMTVAACSPKEKKSAQVLTDVPTETAVAKGPERMQVSDIKATFTYRGKEYNSTVVRRPDATLPQVKDEEGNAYVDNRISLRLVCGSKVVVDKSFTKEDFATQVDAQFLKHALLEGLVYDKTTDRGIVYAASVAYPQSDLYIPLRLTVSPNGAISIEKDELMEEYLPEEADTERTEP